MKALGYDGPPELLTMYLCLVPTHGCGVKRTFSDLVGDCFLHVGRMFQTRISKFKISSLKSDVREGAVDVVAKGLAVLCSSLDEPGRASLDGDALYAYDVVALRALHEDTKAKKK